MRVRALDGGIHLVRLVVAIVSARHDLRMIMVDIGAVGIRARDGGSRVVVRRILAVRVGARSRFVWQGETENLQGGNLPKGDLL